MILDAKLRSSSAGVASAGKLRTMEVDEHGNNNYLLLLQQREEENREEVTKLTAEIRSLKLQLLQLQGLLQIIFYLILIEI